MLTTLLVYLMLPLELKAFIQNYQDCINCICETIECLLSCLEITPVNPTCKGSIHFLSLSCQALPGDQVSVATTLYVKHTWSKSTWQAQKQ